jgi:hypothetical protein
MSVRTCARCGTSVGPDEYLCWRCRQELPAEPAAPAAAGQPLPGTAATRTVERTFRGGRVPEGMVLPSRTQYHGTVLGAIAIGVVIVLTLGVLVSGGVGPFTVANVSIQRIDSLSGAGSVGEVDASVTNTGQHTGRARCVALWSDAEGSQHPTRSFQTAQIRPSGTATISIPLPAGALLNAVTVDCK